MSPDTSSADVFLVSARERLDDVSRALAHVLAGSEQVFLDAGSRLSGIADCARRLLVDVSDPSSTGSGADAAEEVSAALARLERYLETSRAASVADAGELSRLLVSVDRIADARGPFEDIARSLRVLGISTRIENSRLGTQSSGMETVAAEVRRLGERVNRDSFEIVQRASRVRETASAAAAASEAFLRRQGPSSAGMLDDTRQALEALRSFARSEAEASGKASTASERIAGSVTTVLVSLQCHDAIRQMIEHTGEELRAFEDDAAAASSAGALDAAAWVLETADVCRLVGAQLRGAREKLLQALAAISASLRGMATLVTELGDHSARLAGLGDDAAPLERVQRSVGQAIRLLHDHLDRERATATAMRPVTGCVGEMAAHIRDVAATGQAVKIIALNALVETERTGADGRVLAVLAKATATLAADVAGHTAGVSLALQELTRASEKLGRLADESREAAHGEDIAGELQRVVEALSRHHGELRASVAALRRNSQALREEVEAIDGQLVAQADGLGDGLRRLEEQLAQLAQETAAHADPAAPRGAPVRRSAALARYTMDAERQIHRDVVVTGEALASAAGPADPGGEVEFF